eukprot:gene10676-16421_t
MSGKKDGTEEILKSWRFDDDETSKIVFKNLARDGRDDEISEDEFLRIMQKTPLYQNRELQEMIDEADRDEDGEISEDQFLRIMKKTSS